MAIPEADLGEYDDEARRTLGDFGEPPSGEGPDPSDLDEISPPPVAPPVDLTPPEIGSEGPTMEQPLEAPAAPVVSPTTEGPPPSAAAPSEALAARQGAIDVERAKIQAATADRQAQEAQTADEDARLERAEFLQRRQDAERDLNDRIKAYESTKLTDPKERTNSVKSWLAVIFGGLGAGMRGDNKNTGLEALQQRWHDDTELQKANISALRESAVMARTRLGDVDAGRRVMLRDADARLVAKYNLALKQGEAQLRNQGANQAQIDADGRIVKLRAGQAAAKIQAQKDEDAHLLNQARITRLNAQAGRDRSKTKGKGGGGGGGGGGAGRGDASAQVADYLTANPGDTGGARRLAGQLGVPEKTLNAIVNQTKPTESQTKAAEFGKAGIRAVTSLEKTKYVPTAADTDRWLQNQRDVYQAQQAGSGGGLSGLAGSKIVGGLQSIGLMAKSEVEGLSPEAQEYFANVRRLMEPLGRAKSGAAISQGEWVNFFNQYGPQSSGGYAAARKDLEDSLKLSGVAGRSLGTGAAAPVNAGPTPEQIKQAKAALADPSAPAEVISRAKAVIRDAGNQIKL